MPDYILGLVVSAIVALLVKKTNIAGGMLIGAIIGMAFCCIVLETSALPVEFKLTAQIMAGIFIGAGVKREELLHLPRLAGPISLLMVIYTLFAISMGAIMPMVSDMDAITGMMCAVPGGMSDMPIIAADFGADVPTVAIFQFVRMIGGVAVFPSVITFVLRNSPESVAVEVEQHPTNPPTPPKPQRLWLILLVGGIAGLYGQTTSIPAGGLVVSMFGVIGLKFAGVEGTPPIWFRRVAQVLSGAYIGTQFDLNDFIAMAKLLPSSLVLLAGYMIISIVMGYVMNRVWKMDRGEAMLSCTPAGASDMALIATDLGMDSADLIIIQVARFIYAVGVLPAILGWAVTFF